MSALLSPGGSLAGWDFIAAIVVVVCGIGYAIIPPRCRRPNPLAVQCDRLEARRWCDHCAVDPTGITCDHCAVTL